MTCFGGPFTLAALGAFPVTVADLPLSNIDAALRGLVAGILVLRLLERADITRTNHRF